MPFADGTAFGQWLDDDKTQAGLEELGVSTKDIAGYWEYEEIFDATRKKLRTGPRDTWIGDSPTRAEIEELLAGEQLMQDIVFDASISELLDEYMDDQRLKDALFGQGVIASWGGPKDKGTASIKLMHYQGDLEGQGPVWGYVKGGMGMISFAIADAAREFGAQLATGVPVAQILPGEGVVLEDGTTIRAKTVVSNADPKITMRLLEGQDVPGAYSERIDAWKVRSPVVKFNAVLSALPEFTAAPGERFPVAGDGRPDARSRGRAGRRGRVRARRDRRRLRRGLRADRLRPDAGARGLPPAQRVRAVRAVRPGARRLGLAARRGRASSSSR